MEVKIKKINQTKPKLKIIFLISSFGVAAFLITLALREPTADKSEKLPGSLSRPSQTYFYQKLHQFETPGGPIAPTLNNLKRNLLSAVKSKDFPAAAMDIAEVIYDSNLEMTQQTTQIKDFLTEVFVSETHRAKSNHSLLFYLIDDQSGTKILVLIIENRISKNRIWETNIVFE